MRDIKFRAWDKNNKGFINGFNMFGFSTGQGAPKRKLQRFSNEWNEEDIELMQYTGLKDKNDKEIYEGDIIKLTYADKKTVFECVVKYVDDCAYYMLEDIKDSDNLDTFCGFSNEQFEVIGNIYENPELLESAEPTETFH